MNVFLILHIVFITFQMFMLFLGFDFGSKKLILVAGTGMIYGIFCIVNYIMR